MVIVRRLLSISLVSRLEGETPEARGLEGG